LPLSDDFIKRKLPSPSIQYNSQFLWQRFPLLSFIASGAITFLTKERARETQNSSQNMHEQSSSQLALNLNLIFSILSRKMAKLLAAACSSFRSLQS
jgi:hypothetical protein